MHHDVDVCNCDRSSTHLNRSTRGCDRVLIALDVYVVHVFDAVRPRVIRHGCVLHIENRCGKR